MDNELRLKPYFSIADASIRISKTLEVDLQEDDVLQMLLDRRLNGYLSNENVLLVVPLGTFVPDQNDQFVPPIEQLLTWSEAEAARLNFTIPDWVRPNDPSEFFRIVDIRSSMTSSYTNQQLGTAPTGTLIEMSENAYGLAFSGTKILIENAPYKFDELFPSVRNFIRWLRNQLDQKQLAIRNTAVRNSLSSLSDIVIPASEIVRFESSFASGGKSDQQTKPGKPLSTRELRSAQQIIAVLAAIGNVDITTPYKAAAVLRQAAAQHGLELPSSDDTIKKFLRSE